VSKLQQMVGISQQQVIDLLVSMNISGLINAKIDEEKGSVLVLAA
jgi:predicted transcriptional regulator